MLTRPTTAFHFLNKKDPIPTVEIDLDRLPDGSFPEQVVRALAKLAAENRELVASVYVSMQPSVNFGDYSYSAFVGVVGPQSLLRTLYEHFVTLPDARVRYSDYILTSDAWRDYHVEAGMVWRNLDEITLYAGEPQEADETSEDDDEDALLTAEEEWDDDDDEAGEDDQDETEDTASVVDEPAGRTPPRFRVARSDASVGTIRQRIEKLFGLPAGSVALCDESGRAMRADAKIGTLRRRWAKA